jgi:DNA-binding NarL/FixJ family response regulator
MRVILVGSAAARERLRLRLDAVAEIVSEHPTLAAARADAVEADAIVLPYRRLAGDPSAAEGLTARETQVLELMAEGLPNKSIAARLGISDQTVKFHVASIAGKLGAANRTDAVRLALRRGLITI